MEICDTAFDCPVPGGEQWSQFPVLWYITSNATIKRLFESQFVCMQQHVSSVSGGHKPICFGVMLLYGYNSVKEAPFIDHV